MNLSNAVNFRYVNTTLLCPKYPDWSIAAAGSSLKIGYEYARSVTGEGELPVDLDAYEEEKGSAEVSVFKCIIIIAYNIHVCYIYDLGM